MRVTTKKLAWAKWWIGKAYVAPCCDYHDARGERNWRRVVALLDLLSERATER